MYRSFAAIVSNLFGFLVIDRVCEYQQSPKTLLDAMPLLSPIPESSTAQEMSARMMFAKHRRGAARGGFGGMASRTVAGSVLGLSKAEDVTVLDEESSPIMNALFSSDSHGRFRLRLFGGFNMESISLSEMLQTFAPHQFQVLYSLVSERGSMELHFKSLTGIFNFAT